MEKVEVKVCVGTTCFVMGAGNLQGLVDLLPERFGNKVDVSGSACLGICNQSSEFSKAPYVKVNDVVVAEATVDKVIEEVERQLAK